MQDARSNRSGLSRKERERQQREGLIVETARGMMAAQGYLGLNMDRLAEQVEYSKGTLYQHFKTKEDLILAVAVDAMDARRGLFARADEFVGGTRERITAFGVADYLFTRIYPEHFQIETLVRGASLWEKTSDPRRDQLNSGQEGCLGRMVRLVQLAAQEGDYDPKISGMNPESVAESLKSISAGFHLTAPNAEQDPGKALANHYLRLRQAQTIFLDGLQWRPLSSDWDYHSTRLRVMREVFDQECQQLHLMEDEI